MKTSLSILCLLLVVYGTNSWAKGKAPKVQEVQFDGSDVDGQARNPDGAYLVQKKGVRFLPLYKVKDKFDSNMRILAEYMR